MNTLESLVYHTVKNNPKIKNVVRDLYQALFSLIPVRANRLFTRL